MLFVEWCDCRYCDIYVWYTDVFMDIIYFLFRDHCMRRKTTRLPIKTLRMTELYTIYVRYNKIQSIFYFQHSWLDDQMILDCNQMHPARTWSVHDFKLWLVHLSLIACRLSIHRTWCKWSWNIKLLTPT